MEIKVKHDIPTEEELKAVAADWRVTDELPWFQKFRETPLAIVEENEMPQWKTAEQLYNAVEAMGTNFVRYPAIGWGAHFFKESSTLQKHIGMTKDEDFFGDVVKYFHKRGGMVCSYNHFGGVMYKEVGDKHPDWVYRDKEGNPEFWNGMHYLGCLSSDDFVNSMLTAMDEYLTAYGNDAVYLDAPSWYTGNCYCDACKNNWRELYNEELPDVEFKTSENYKKLIRYREIRLYNIVKAVHAVTQKHGVPLIINARGQRNYNMGNKELNISHAEGANAGEGYRPSTTFWRMMALWRFGEAQKKISYAYCPIGPYYNMRSHGTDEALLSGMAEAMFGTTPFLESATSYLFDTTGGDKLKIVCDNIKKHANMYYRSYPIRDLAIVISSSTICNNDRSDMSTLFSDAYGVVESLSKSNRHFDTIFDTQLSEERLKGYRVLYLPQARYISKQTEEILKNFVKNGGNVICGPDFSRYGEDDMPIDKYALSDFIGVNFDRLNDRTNIDKRVREYRETAGIYEYSAIPEAYVKLVKDLPNMKASETPVIPFSDHVVRIMNPINMFYVLAKAQEDTEVLAEFYLPAGGLRGEDLSFPEGNPPAITRKKYGEGYVYWFGFRPGFSYCRQGLIDLQEIIRAVCDMAGDGPIVDYSSYGAVPCFYVEDKQGVRYLHLANVTGTMHENSFMIDKIAPLFDMPFKVKEDKPITSIKTVYSNTTLPFERKDGYVYFTLPKLEIYETIEIK